MQGSPSPGVSHDGGTHEQKPVENRCVATPSCKVQGSGSFVILRCQANVCERDLVRESKKTAVSGGWTWGSHPQGGGTGALRAEVGLPSRDSQWAVEIPPGYLEAELACPTCPVTHVASQVRAQDLIFGSPQAELHSQRGTVHGHPAIGETERTQAHAALGRLRSSGRVLLEAWAPWHLPPQL